MSITCLDLAYMTHTRYVPSTVNAGLDLFLVVGRFCFAWRSLGSWLHFVNTLIEAFCILSVRIL
jgi:hypothetical protein